MKKVLPISFLFFVTFFTNGQTDIRQLTCLGENIKNIETDQIISSSKDTGTIFTIYENDKTIKVKTATRYQGFQDEFYYDDFIESPHAKIYTCYRVGDKIKTKYFISILSGKVTLMTGSRIIEDRIVSDNFIDD